MVLNFSKWFDSIVRSLHVPFVEVLAKAKEIRKDPELRSSKSVTVAMGRKHRMSARTGSVG